MKKLTIFLVLLMGLAFVHNLQADMEHKEMTPYTGSTEFEKLKSLAGNWEGTHEMGDVKDPVTVEYFLTANGSALVEKLFPGTPHEMVSVYHDKKGKLSMTHYCVIGNQPRMNLMITGEDKMEFSLSDDSDIDVATEEHMHDLILTFVNADHIVHNWTMYVDGQKQSTNTITLSRVH